jgi:eukaryotic-like serine/threonine-protein kinase
VDVPGKQKQDAFDDKAVQQHRMPGHVQRKEPTLPMRTNDAAATALTLFDRYAEMPHAALSNALTDLQREDADVCAALMRLLAADEQTHSFASPLQWFAEQSGSAQNDSAPMDSQTVDRIWPDGTRLGPWCVDGIIGLGGMGVIYAAHRADGLYEREVALKTIRAEIMSPALQQAFAKERSHLAKLEHPSIVALYDAGVLEDGQPWLAMARVHGEAIDRWCDAQKTDLRARVGLLIETCDAIAYAHAHGVLHQDIKPSNLLVNDEGKVKLLDFGLSAMLTPHGDGSFTRIGVSSAYAAPEVFDGAPPSVAIDVYALGVVLYRLLCNDWPRTPRTVTAQPDARDKAAQTPSLLATRATPATARTRSVRNAQALSGALKGDLDAIAQRCVSHDPVARYASVSDLRADLQAWLERRPVAASDGGWAYRASRFMRRNAIAVAATAVLVSASTAGGLVALQQQQRANLEAENGEILSDLFEKSLGAATLNSLGSAPLSSKTLLEDTERQLRTAAGKDRPQFLARGLAVLARAYMVRLEYEKTERLLVESTSLGASDWLQNARTNALLAQLMILRSKPIDAERFAKQGLAIIPVRDGIEDDLIRLDLERQYGRSRARQGDTAGAFAILDKSIRSAKSLGKNASSALSLLLRARGRVYVSTGREDEGEQDLRDALALVDDNDLIALNETRVALSNRLANKGDVDEAHRLVAEVLISSIEVFGPTHAQTGQAWIYVAKSWYQSQVDMRRAKIGLAQSEKILSNQFGPAHPMLEDVFMTRSALSLENDELEDALKYARRVVDIRQRSYGAYSSSLETQDNLATILIALARSKSGKQQEAYYREADSVLSKIIRDGEKLELDMGYARANRVGPLLYFKHIDEAERQAKFELDRTNAQYGADNFNTDAAATDLMWVRVAQGRYDEAAALLVPVLEHLPPIEESPHRHYKFQCILLDIEIARGDPTRIRAQYLHVRKIAERYGIMDALNARHVPGISPTAKHQ